MLVENLDIIVVVAMYVWLIVAFLLKVKDFKQQLAVKDVEIDHWNDKYLIEQKSRGNLQMKYDASLNQLELFSKMHANLTIKYMSKCTAMERVIEQARKWKSDAYWYKDEMENRGVVIQKLKDDVQFYKEKAIFPAPVKKQNGDRPLDGEKKTWKFKKPKTISRSQLFRRKATLK